MFEMPIAAEAGIGCGRASLTSKTIHAAVIHPVYGKRRSRAGQQRMRETPLRLKHFALNTARRRASFSSVISRNGRSHALFQPGAYGHFHQ
jgi:hypothetical protein